ncbi:PTS lactose/cellobiose transporter subunit IIA [Herbiconiux sp. VKM Ac-1786]|uniref:PTS lactose/cellobiose transporter subunit IIA n=1 Tax=Herbiconiux sp. VKM Ac-1786 TaxID=2783824 RepID=UPI00210339D6|nr:PTS lactose/cellobiose transporter subunit IIA [Herbiconiux sp. VKM Ac-1786]
MPMIAAAGEGRALVFEALDTALDGDVAGAEALLAEADERIREAHLIQFRELIRPEAAGENVPVKLIVVHAMDTLMITMSERDLAKRLIDRRWSRRVGAADPTASQTPTPSEGE